ncbi:hypothetical protein BGZ88_012348 [Linnemannia elongata]|nr:hypothetical protein BGZ88_012348 [Linnemannia elongata]
MLCRLIHQHLTYVRRSPEPTPAHLRSTHRPTKVLLLWADVDSGGGRGGAWIQGCVRPTSCDLKIVAMVLQTFANLRTAACESLLATSGENSTAATANEAAPATPPVLSSTTIPMQQSENAATSLTAVLGTIAAVFASLLL